MNAGLSVRLGEQRKNVLSPLGSFMTRRTGRAEMQTEISRRAIREGRRDSISIKGIMTLPLFDNLETPFVVFSFHLK